MMWALEEFFLSRLGVNIAVGAHRGWPGLFPQRLLVIDEFGTFASMAERMHRRTGGQGRPPSLDQRRQIEWQGRQAGHRLVVAVHQPNLHLFGDTDSRGQYGYRLITGAYTSSLWRMTFGYTPPIQWDTRIKGRGVVGIGEAEELIHHAQLAWMPADERRRYGLSGPPRPSGSPTFGPPPGSPVTSSLKAANSPAPRSSGCLPATLRRVRKRTSRWMSRPGRRSLYQSKDLRIARSAPGRTRCPRSP
jgi:hypothetical protein